MTISASARSAVEPFHAMDVLADANRLRQEGHEVVSLAVGQPGDPAPAIIRAAAARALQAGRIGYTDALGLPDLRAAISRHYGEQYGVDVAPARIVVTTGSSAGFNLAFLAMFDPGDRVAITVPGYPAYRNILKALGLDVVEIRLGEEGYLTAALLEAAHREAPLRGVLFASPANPTGAVIPADALASLLAAAREMGIAAISDEIYHRLAYGERDQTALSHGSNVAVINSFSKYYCMTGWRIGWMVLPDAMVRPVERLQQSLYISPPELSQLAALEAFSATVELDLIKERYRRNRALLIEALPKLGLPIAAPMDGAFYAYCDASVHTDDTMDFARRMLAETHVAMTPGVDFDVAEGRRFLRLSYCGTTEEIETALARLGGWLKM